MGINSHNGVGPEFIITGLTATGSNQAGAFPLLWNTLYEFTTAAAGTGAILPAWNPNAIPAVVTVSNAGANPLNIYPQSGGAITGGTVNAPVALAAGNSVTYWASSPTNWYLRQTVPLTGFGTPGGTSGQIQYDNAGAFGGFTASGDATINTTTGAVAVTKTAGVAFAPSATTDTTSASNITSGLLSPSIGGLGVAANAAANGEIPIGTGTGLALATITAGANVTVTNASGGITIAAASGGTSPGGISGQIQYDNAGAFGGFSASGDATITPSTGAVVVTKTNGVAFAPSATTDATNASNISSGTLAAAQLPALSGAITTTAGSATTAFGPIATKNLVGNTTSGTAAPAGVTLTSLIDAAIDNTQGDLLYRSATAWTNLPPSTAPRCTLECGGAGGNPIWNQYLLLPASGPAIFTTGPFIGIASAGTAVANTTTQTSLFTGAGLRTNQSLTFPANSLIAGQNIRLILAGTYSAVTTNTLQILILLGGSVVAESTATAMTATVTNGAWFTYAGPIQFFFPAVGSSGLCLCKGNFALENTAASNQQITTWAGGTGSGSGAGVAVNTTAALAIDVQVKWGTASASNSIQLTAGYAELIG